MRLVGLAILLLALAVGVGANMEIFIDAPSLIIIFGFTFGVLFMSGTSVGSMFRAVFSAEGTAQERVAAARSCVGPPRFHGRGSRRHNRRSRHHWQESERHRQPGARHRHLPADPLLRVAHRLWLLPPMSASYREHSRVLNPISHALVQKEAGSPWESAFFHTLTSPPAARIDSQPADQ